MGNICKWIENEIAKTGEVIEAVVVGQRDDLNWADAALLPDENVILTATQGLSKLDVEYDDGFGGADCFPMYLWTEKRVYFISEYDGATGLAWVPRNPINCTPHFDGEPTLK